MNLIDLITVIYLIAGLLITFVVHTLIKQRKIIPRTYPNFFGIGVLVYSFVSFVVADIILKGISSLKDSAYTNLLWSLALGAAGYIGGIILQKRAREK